MSTSRGKTPNGLAVALGLFWLCLFCHEAESAAPPRIYTLHIEPQPLDGALQEFARQTGLQILFFSRLTEGRRSVSLDGMYTVDIAMKTMLSGSNLTYRVVNTKTIQIVLRRTARANGERGLFRSVDALSCHSSPR
jgi:hypothetical protein